jgi:hypothetical protein
MHASSVLRRSSPVVHDQTTLSTRLFEDRSKSVIRNHDKESPLFLMVSFPNFHRPQVDLSGQGLFTEVGLMKPPNS